VKICVVGGGSTSTPELVGGILWRLDRLPVEDLVLLDRNAQPAALALAGLSGKLDG
jgi:alpha-galactosidase/6-phospho-beta-glucosidase family protein